jgi:integrase/recombinase XerD
MIEVPPAPEYVQRTPVREKAKQFAKLLRKENPDYTYMRELFRALREDLDIPTLHLEKKRPYIPTEEEIRNYYRVVWQSRNMQNIMIVKTLMYTGVRLSELIKIQLCDIDFDTCQIKIAQGRTKKARIVPFPVLFTEVLALHADTMKKKGAKHLFESSWKKPYTQRGVQRILEAYRKESGMTQSISPLKLRRFLFAWLKKQGIENAFILPYSGHDSPKSLEIYSDKLSIREAQEEYTNVIQRFPI